MSPRPDGQVRASQVIRTWGPGAVIDLPRQSGIVGGLEQWPRLDRLEEIVDPRLTRKVAIVTGVDGARLFAPPPDEAGPGEQRPGIGVWRFPDWMVVQEGPDGGARARSRRLVHRRVARPAGALRRARRDRHEVRTRLPAGSHRRRRLEALRPRRQGRATASSCGSTSAGPAVTSPISSCAANAGSRAASTRPPTSASCRSASAAARARGSASAAVRNAACQAAC